MMLSNWVGVLIAAGLAAYLTLALLKPEKFS